MRLLSSDELAALKREVRAELLSDTTSFAPSTPSLSSLSLFTPSVHTLSVHTLSVHTLSVHTSLRSQVRAELDARREEREREEARRAPS